MKKNQKRTIGLTIGLVIVAVCLVGWLGNESLTLKKTPVPTEEFIIDFHDGEACPVEPLGDPYTPEEVCGGKI
jgi:hypothetical protein